MSNHRENLSGLLKDQLIPLHGTTREIVATLPARGVIASGILVGTGLVVNVGSILEGNYGLAAKGATLSVVSAGAAIGLNKLRNRLKQ